MGIFNKTTDTYTYADVAELIGAVEGAVLEFKERTDPKDPWNDLLKELVAFANTYGGYLVLGAEEDKSGKLTTLPGVDPIDGFRQKIIDLCLARVIPPITPYPAPPITVPGTKRVVYVIRMPLSMSGPHFMSDRRGAYVRVAEHNKPYLAKPAEWEELVNLAERRKQAVGHRSALAERAARRATRVMPGDAVLFEMFVGPAYPSGHLVPLSTLRKHVEKSRVEARGTLFPYGTQETLFESVAFVLDPNVRQEEYFETTIYGSVFSSIDIRSAVEGKERVYFAWVLAYCILWPLYGRRFFQAIGYEGPVFISANLRRMADRQFVWTGERWFTGHLDSVPRFDDEAEASSETTTKDMEENLARIVVGLFHPLAHACGLDDLLAVSPTDLLQKAYEYLMWDHATVLANKTEP